MSQGSPTYSGSTPMSLYRGLDTAYSMIGCGNTTGTSGNLSFDVQWQE